MMNCFDVSAEWDLAATKRILFGCTAQPGGVYVCEN